jgi:hypothetical protein
MKAKITILVIIGILLSSCEGATATQEGEVATEAPAIEAPVTQESVVTEEPVTMELPTESPTEIPTAPPLACVTLLTPNNGIDIPPVGKVTFSWTPMDEAGNYVLNIILPSGETVSFTTDKTFRDRYMEAFVTGGEYQWQVIAQGTDGSEICVSEVATFDKPAYQKPNGGGGGSDGSGGLAPCDVDPFNCGDGGGGDGGGNGGG